MSSSAAWKDKKSFTSRRISKFSFFSPSRSLDTDWSQSLAAMIPQSRCQGAACNMQIRNTAGVVFMPYYAWRKHLRLQNKQLRQHSAFPPAACKGLPWIRSWAGRLSVSTWRIALGGGGGGTGVKLATMVGSIWLPRIGPTSQKCNI
jgi:hypothetical protein